MGKKKGGKKSKIEGAQRSRSASKCEDSANKPIVIENQENLASEEQTVETSPVTVAEKIKVDLIRSDSNDRCASPSSSSALELLAEIEKDNKQEKLQHQNSIKNATEMINEIDQGLDVLSMEAITRDSENEETKPTKPISQENQKKDEAITSMPQSTLHGAKEEITDEKTENETSDQPEEEYGFMEPMTLDSEDEDELENVPKTVPEIVPNKQRSLESEIAAQKEDNVLNMESTAIDTENKEAKIEVKEDKIPQEVTDTKADETFDQPEEEYGFMEALTLDSEDEDELENVHKTVPEIVPNRQKSPEPEDEKEVKIEVKEDKNPQILSKITGLPGTEEFVPAFLLLPLSRDKGTTGRQVPSRWKPCQAQEPELNDTKIIEPQKNFAEEVITVDALDMEAITMDSEEEEEEKFEIKEDKISETPEPELNDMKIIEHQKNFAEEVITVDVLDMEAITMDSEDDEEEKIEVKEDNIKEPEINDTKIIESEKTPVEEDLELDVLDMEGMKLDSDQDNKDEVETIPQKIEPNGEKTDATLNGEIEILDQEENLNQKQQEQNGGEKVTGTSSLTIQLKRTKSGAKIQDTYFIKRQNGMYDQVKDKNLVIVNAQALAKFCQEYNIKVEKFFEAPSSQIEVSNSIVSQIKKTELKLSGKMSH